MQVTVTVSHDDAKGVWFIERSDVPGLNAEAETFEALVEAVTDLTPDLAAANLPGAFAGDSRIRICVQHVVDAGHARAA